MQGLRRWAAAMAATTALAGCAMAFGFGAPPLATLREICGSRGEYGADTPAIYSTYLDAYVAYRHKRLSKDQYCAFQTSIDQRHTALANGDAAARSQWTAFFNEARVQAIDWRAAVDSTLRGG